MSVINTVSRIMTGFGFPGVLVKKEGVNQPINVTTTTTFSNANLNNIPNFHSGIIRIKTQNTIALTYPGTGAGQVTSIKVTITDGTNTLVLINVPTFAANDLFDLIVPFITDLDATSISIAVAVANVANGQATLDFEVAVNQ